MNKPFKAFLDFAGSPYALGDILTWNMITCTEALYAGRERVDIWVLSEPENPSNRYQFYITGLNHQKFLLDLMPAFYTNPMLGNMHFLQSGAKLERQIFDAHIAGEPCFPGLDKYKGDFRPKEALYSSHDRINQWYAENGWVPRLALPKGIRTWAENFLKSFNPNSFIVTVHLRNRKNETDTFAADVFRDAGFDVWSEFFDRAKTQFPDVTFLLVGRPVEWPREFYRRSNLIPLKSMGYGLIEELAMIQCCDLFMATNSGPAVMAVFSETPYVIFQRRENEKLTSELWGVEIGAERLPFATEHQTVFWGETTVEVIERELRTKMDTLYNR
jgi:hypothetical protein